MIGKCKRRPARCEILEFRNLQGCYGRRLGANTARNRPGVTSISRRKMAVRWLWSTKPAAYATQASGWLVRSLHQGFCALAIKGRIAEIYQ
jgi:hypothetical protein